MKTVVADAGPLIALAVNNLIENVERIIQSILIPEDVFRELRTDTNLPGARILNQAITRDYITIAKIPRNEIITEDGLGMGENAAISMAGKKELVLLLDEIKARKTAKLMGIKVIGTGRILIELKRKREIDNVRRVLESFENSGYRFSDEIRTRILTAAKEI